MIINNLEKGIFISRPNRFTVEFKTTEGMYEIAHLHDPGRLKELLLENVEILVRYIPPYKKSGRKTKYDVIGIKYLNEWVLLNSSFHNHLVKELIENKEIKELEKYHIHKPEYTYGNSRLDFLLKDDNNNELFLEVKGCTLVVNHLAKFPDAPTVRGKKHVDELIKIQKENKKGNIIILVLQNTAEKFSPNYETDPEFSLSLETAYKTGVSIYPIHIITKYENKSLELVYDKILPIKFIQSNR